MRHMLKALWSFYGRQEKRYLVGLSFLTLALAGTEAGVDHPG